MSTAEPESVNEQPGNDGVPRRCGHVIEHELDGELLLYDPVGERTHRLNATAGRIWRACSGEATIEDIAARLTEDYEVDLQTALRDTHNAVRVLEQEQLVARRARAAAAGMMPDRRMEPEERTRSQRTAGCDGSVPRSGP